jgi:hypothetical protein
MSAIRPDLPAALPQTGTAPAVRAAQADFFRAALSRAETGQAGAVQPTMTPITVEPPRPSGEGRAMRPGSLLDIRV